MNGEPLNIVLMLEGYELSVRLTGPGDNDEMLSRAVEMLGVITSVWADKAPA